MHCLIFMKLYTLFPHDTWMMSLHLEFPNCEIWPRGVQKLGNFSIFLRHHFMHLECIVWSLWNFTHCFCMTHEWCPCIWNFNILKIVLCWFKNFKILNAFWCYHFWICNALSHRYEISLNVFVWFTNDAPPLGIFFYFKWTSVDPKTCI